MNPITILIIEDKPRLATVELFTRAQSLKRAFTANIPDCFVTVTGSGYPNYFSFFYEDSYYFDIIIVIGDISNRLIQPISKINNNSTFILFWNIDKNRAEHDRFSTNLLNPQFVLCNNKHAMRIIDGFDRIIYFPNCYDDELFAPKPDVKKYNLGLCRVKYGFQGEVPFISSKYEIRTDNVDRSKMADAINSYNIRYFKSFGSTISNDVFETMGCKTCVVTNHVADIDSVFDVGTHLLTFETIEDLDLLIGLLLKKPEHAQAIATAGYNLVKEKHTYRNRAATIIDLYKSFINR